MSTHTKWIIVMALSLARIPAAIAIVVMAAAGQWWLVLAVAAAGFATDFVDGWLARRWKVVSEIGMLVDPLTDKIICLTLLAVLAAAGNPWIWLFFGVFLVYDIFTMALRLMLSRFVPMPAHNTAKLKTATLMISLLTGVVGEVFYTLPQGRLLTGVGLALLVAATALTVKSGLEYFRWVKRMRLSDWLELHESVADIDFDAWYKAGIRALLFDIEGTITHWRNPDVPPEIVRAIKKARKAGITKIGLVTNMHRKHYVRAGRVAEQIEADTYHFPNSMFDRKPSPAMAHFALKKMAVNPKQTAFIGDKVIDVLTGNAAGVHKAAWVNRLGEADHAYDRYVYRRAERLLKRVLFRSGQTLA